MKIAVISSVYGNYDQLNIPAAQSREADWIMVTDKRGYVEPPWREVVECRPQLHPRLAAKVARCNPQLYSDADVFIYIDGNVKISSHNFVNFCVTSLNKAPVCAYPITNRPH